MATRSGESSGNRRAMMGGHKRKKISGGLDPEFGAIFMSNTRTKEECLREQLFGLPSTHHEFVRKVKSGMLLFLFEYENRKLYGVFKAVSDGEVNIVPSAYRYTSSGKSFPAQVRVRRIMHCEPLSEYEFSGAIKDNYYGFNKFNFGLSKHQVQDLLLLFNSRNDSSTLLLRENKLLTRGGGGGGGGGGQGCSWRSLKYKIRRTRKAAPRYLSNDDSVAAAKVELSSSVTGYSSDKKTVIAPDVAAASRGVGSECQISSSNNNSKTTTTTTLLIESDYSSNHPGALNPPPNHHPSSSSQSQILQKKHPPDSICCEETLMMAHSKHDIVRSISNSNDDDDDLGDFIPLCVSSDDEEEKEKDPAEEELDAAGCGDNDHQTASHLYGKNAYWSSLVSSSFGGEESAQLVVGHQRFAASVNPNKESCPHPWIVVGSSSSVVDIAAPQSSDVKKGCLYCDTPPAPRKSVFSRLNLAAASSTEITRDKENRARADKFVDEIMEGLQRKYDFNLLGVTRQEKQKHYASTLTNPPKRNGGVFQRLG